MMSYDEKVEKQAFKQMTAQIPHLEDRDLVPRCVDKIIIQRQQDLSVTHTHQ